MVSQNICSVSLVHLLQHLELWNLRFLQCCTFIWLAWINEVGADGFPFTDWIALIPAPGRPKL